MRLPQQDKPDLLHMVVDGPRRYDPVKAHEYYMRTRQLHPRQRGARPLSGQRAQGRVQALVGLKRPAAKQPAQNNPALAKQRAQIAATVRNLQTKLQELKNTLATKQAALNRSTKAKLSPSQAKQKHQQAAKKYQQSHKQLLAQKAKTARAKGKATGGGKTTQSVVANPKSGSIKEVQAAIKSVEAALAAAQARQRALG